MQGYRFLDPPIDKHLPDFPSYWRLEDELDLFGPNDMTNVGSVTFQAGFNGLAAYFDTGDYLNISDAAQSGLEPGGGFFISALVFIVAFGADPYHTVVSKSRSAGNNASYELMVRKSTSVVNFGISDSGMGITLNMETVGSIVLNQWNFIQASFVPSTEIAVYLNGVKENVTVGVPASVNNGNADFRIGNRDSGGFSARMNGRIDEVGFINKTQTVAEADATAASFFNSGAGRFPIRPETKTVSVFDMRQKTFGVTVSRFDIIRDRICSVTVSRFDSRAKTLGKTISRFDIKANTVSKTVSRFDSREKNLSITLSRFGIRGKSVSKTISLSNSFFQDGFKLVARNIVTGIFTELGFIPEGSTTLNGIALADGTYDIEARPSGNYWDDVRSTLFLRVEIVTGEIVAAKPPAVRNLRFLNLTDFGRDILWTYQNDFGTVEPVDFGIWFSATSPVNTAGAPDLTITARDPGSTHLRRRTQVATEFVAVAARDASEVQGPASEILLPFPSGAITSPDRQWAVKGN